MPQSPAIDILSHGRVAPLLKLELSRNGVIGTFDGGVYHTDNSPCARGLQIKSSYRNVPHLYEKHEPVERIPGRHLFGGLLQNGHFGHFMAESLSRLWAIRHLHPDYCSTVFYLRNVKRPVPGYAKQLLELIEPSITIRGVTGLTEFETLAVPDQVGNSGMGFISGHPFNRELVAPLRKINGAGARKIYVSRSKLTPQEGGVLAEELIEANLIASGYTILHPQEMAIRDQIGAYNDAESLIFAEGSALHLYALVTRPDQRIYVIWRRKPVSTFAWQIRSFGGSKPLGSPCIQSLWVPEPDGVRLLRARAILDFDALRLELVRHGFIADVPWHNPTRAELETEIDRARSVLRLPYVEQTLTLEARL